MKSIRIQQFMTLLKEQKEKHILIDYKNNI